ncbi:MAG: carboxypeptidase regulatory-like domain-containing protein [Myxococcales bacterium]
MRLLFLAALLATLPAAAQYTEAPVTNGGRVKGRITYNGKAPAPKKITITKDPKICGASRDDDTFLIAKDGGVKNVVVYLSDITSGKKVTADMKPVLDQKGCHYEPHVQVVPLHATLQVKSSDPILHNVHSFLNGGTVINFAMPPQPGLVLTKKLDKPGGEQLKCDVHSFMTGGIFVAGNPYFALTDDDGSYEIKDVPAGTYSIATCHQAAGPLSGSVTVAAGSAATIDGKVR